MLRTSDDLLQAFELHIRKPSFLVGNEGRYTRNILRQTGLPGDEFDRILNEHRDLIPVMNLGAWAGPREAVSAEPYSGNETNDFTPEFVARATLTSALMRRAAEVANRKRWGFKILGDLIHARQYAAAWPNAHVILLVRDPRDHALSVMALNEQRSERRQPPFYKDYLEVALGWRETVVDGRAAVEQSGLRITTLRYEDLVMSPRTQLERLGEALGIDLTRGCDFHNEGFVKEHTRRFRHHDNLQRPVNADSVGKWRSIMNSEDLEVFQQKIGKEMADWGYE